MSEIRLPGLLTGIDTAALIEQLMAIERRSLNLYQQRQTTWENRQNVLNLLETKLSTLKSAATALADMDKLRSFSAVTSDEDIATAEATYNAFEGNHTVVVNRLATTQRLVLSEGFEYAEDVVGEGTFIFSYNHKETVLTTTASTTLQELAGLINNDANNPGVTASLLYSNDMYHLVLSGNDAGSDYTISINAANTEVWQTDEELTQDGANATLNTKIIELDGFSGTLSGGERIHITGTKHDGTAVDLYMDVTDNTMVSHIIGEIEDAFGAAATASFENGKIILTDNTSGTSQMTLALAYDAGGGGTTLDLPAVSQLTIGGSITASLAGFAQADFLETQSAQDSEIRVDGFPIPRSGVAEVQTLTTAAPATAGTFRLTYNGQTTDAIAYNADIATIQAALEALSNVEAGDITVGGSTLDVGGVMTFTFKDTAGDVNMLTFDSSGLVPAEQSNYVMAEQTKGDNYGWIRRSSNTIDNVIGGVTLHLHNTGTIDLTLTRDIESVKTKIKSLVDAYNFAVNYITENTRYDAANKKAGTLMGDYIISNIAAQLSTPLISQTNGFIEDIDTFLTPAHLGFKLDSDGLLSFDEAVFDEAIAKDYEGVLAIIGADKNGTSSSTTVKFYDASSNNTTAGSYDVEVTVSSGVITSAKIRLEGETAYRDMTISGNLITGNSTFDENGKPLYPENGLSLSVDLSTNGTFNATVRVKQGFAGALTDALENMLATTSGSIQLDQEQAADMLEQIKDKIEREEERLSRTEARLVARFARLEKTLAFIQQQMLALGFSS